MTPKLPAAAAALACIAALAGFAGSATAHVTLEVQEATVGKSYKAVFKVPHGCEKSPTITLRVIIPDGVLGVKPMPKAGWTLETVRGPYSKPYQLYGREVTEGVKEVVWSGGSLADDHYDEFVLATFLAAALPATSVNWPVIQQCEKGERRWVELPAAGQTARDLKSPAPALKLLAAAATADASSFRSGGLVVEQPWSRATPAGAKVAGGYARITNAGSEPDRLLGGTFAEAGKVEVHEMTSDGGIMKMRALANGLEIKPGATVELKPGGYHLMILDLKRPLTQGQSVKGTLRFEKAGPIPVEFTITPPGAQTRGQGHSHH